MEKLAADILSFVKERRHVTFAEIQRRFPEHRGELAITLPDHPNIILWTGMDEELAATISNLLAQQKLVPSPTQPLTYLVDGISLKMPIATALKQYKKPHWFPVTLDISQSIKTKGK